MKPNILLIFGIIGVSLFGLQFGIYYHRAVFGNSDIWWTPKSLALPINNTRNDFEIFLNDQRLQDHLERGSIYATDQNGHLIPLLTEDVVVRLNNWHKIKASSLHTAVYMALFLGASFMLLLIGIAQFIIGKTSDKAPSRFT